MPALALPVHAINTIPSRLNFFLLWRTRRFAIAPVKTFSTSFMVRMEDTPAMQALRDIPYVPSPPDNSLFESWSDEYTTVEVPRLKREHEATRHPNDILRRLVSENKFREAELVRQELVESGVTIRFDGMYYDAALYVLDQAEVDDRARAFSNWWSLLPDKNSENPGRFSSVEQRIFGGNTVDIPTAIQFGLISAEKGYYQRIAKKVVGHIVRFADPAVSTDFLVKLMEADTRWRDSQKRMRPGNREWAWLHAIRTHCAAGRPIEAFKLVKIARDYGVKVDTAALEIVHSKLKSRGYVEAASQLQSLFPDQIKEPPPPSDIAPWPALDSSHPMRKNLRIVLWWLRNSSVKYPARASEITQFFDIYLEQHEGKRFAQLLRSGAYNISYRALSIVVHAEMLYHHHRQEFDAVLLLYKSFFHSGSVPAGELDSTLSGQLDRIGVDAEPSLRGLPKISPFPQKIWPTTYHSSLAWYAMVQLSEDDEQVYKLYTLLLDYVAQARAQNEDTSASHHEIAAPRSDTWQPEEHDPMIAPREMYDSGHFEPFIRRFTASSGPEYVQTRVFEDMHARGVRPSIYNLVTLAGAYAKIGRDPDIALQFLPLIEETEIRPTSEESFEREQMRRERSILVGYTTVLRGYVDRRLLGRAKEVATRMLGQLKYQPGTDPAADEALAWLKFVEREAAEKKTMGNPSVTPWGSTRHPQISDKSPLFIPYSQSVGRET